MLKHHSEKHPGVSEPRFNFKVIKVFQNALARQASEAVWIRRRGELNLPVLNSIQPYDRNALP